MTVEGTGATLVTQLGELAAHTHLGDLPAEVVASVPQRVLDILGICVRSTRLDTSRGVMDFAADQGGRPAATAIGVPERLPAPLSAFVNGTLAHSLDYDDTHLPSILHPSASVIPAALAAAEASGASGSALVAAIAVGLEITVRVGMAGYDVKAGQSVYFEHGQHATSICGALGSAAAASVLLGGSATEAANSMAVAASMASGIIEANRTGGTVKRIHCGWAAQSGVVAAQLVRRGLTGAPTALEGRFGLFESFLRDEWWPEAVIDGLGSTWSVADIFYKPYPANHFTHCAIDAALALRADGLDASDVAAIRIGVATPTARTIGEPSEHKQRPASAYQAQFSGPYCVAAALLGGGGLGVGLDDFTDDLASDPRYRELMAKITVHGDDACDAIYPHQFPAVVEVDTVDGRTLRCEMWSNRGGNDWPLTDRELGQKFTDNATGLLSQDSIASVISSCHQLSNAPDVAQLMSPLSAF